MAQEVEVGSAVGHALDELDAGDVALDLAGAPWCGETCGDGVEVASQAADQRVEGWEVVSKDSLHPAGKLVSVKVVEHLGEVVDVPGGGVEVRAGRTDLLQFRGVGGREVLGCVMIQRTTRRGFGADLGRGRDTGCCFRPGWRGGLKARK